MTNFDFLKRDERFRGFADVAASAEMLLHIDASSCVMNCRRAMESAVKWMYSADSVLSSEPYSEKLAYLMNGEDFRDIVGTDIWRRMDFIRKCGNGAAHGDKKISADVAELCLENLFVFLDFVAYCYGEDYKENEFDRSLLALTTEEAMSFVTETAENSVTAAEENGAASEILTERRIEKQKSYVPKPLELSEYKTRKIYIDAMLSDAGWTEGRDWLNEVELSGMPNKSEVGYADYVLYGDDGRPLAVLEAKRTCADVAKGRQQAKLYADILEKKYGRRPVIFLSNGFETRIQDNLYPERKVACVYSKRDLEKLFNLHTMRGSLKNIAVNKGIAGRYYQEGAVKAVCRCLGEKNRRKALLVMATGSGKTRTVISLCDVLLRHGWIKNILFLADRNSLVTQAKRSFVNLLPNLSSVNLCEDKENFSAHCVFSTYQTMMNCIDSVKDEEGKLFTCGHFDLVICDEAHRSVYNKYRDIFTYFDAPLVGLTATPKDEIDKNTYEIFELENGVPTYGYELSQAVKDGYLVDFMSMETKIKFIEHGIVYDELSDEDKAEYEKTFARDGELPERISSSALNSWVFNEDTIKEVLHVVMTNGLKVDYGQNIGKTVIFAKNHAHAEKIFEIFNKEYPHLPGYAKVIDNQTSYAQSAIDEFSDPKKLPRIAISVDMLDTGIDVPEILNLVFFKKVMSKAKFWQMIGRGTRLCPGLLDGKDKEKFYIFDFCGNFEFFRLESERGTPVTGSVQGAVFRIKSELALNLQDIAYQTEELIKFREALVSDMVSKVRELNKDNFAVRQHLKYVEIYSEPSNYRILSYENTLMMNQELVPLILPYEDDAKAVRFDALLFGTELAFLSGRGLGVYRSDIIKKAEGLSGVANIPEIAAQSEIINKILHTDYINEAGIKEFELIRTCLRNLIKYIPKGGLAYETNFDDEILFTEWQEAELENDDLKNYRMKAEFYIREHQDNPAVAKLKGNVPLTAEDIAELEKILWSEVGSKKDYESEFGEKPLGEFVREIVGLDMNAAKSAFSEYLDNVNLDERQIYFVNQIIEYIVRNGLMKDMSVLKEPPFTDNGSVAEVFSDMFLWHGILSVIERINSNAA